MSAERSTTAYIAELEDVAQRALKAQQLTAELRAEVQRDTDQRIISTPFAHRVALQLDAILEAYKAPENAT